MTGYASKKVFLFEDDVRLAENMQRYLEMKDFVVQHALNGEDGLAMVADFQPDIIVSDVNMPEMDGYCVFKEVQKLLPGIPVIMLTGEHKLKKLFELEGVSAFIKKPCSLIDLEEQICSILEKVS